MAPGHTYINRNGLSKSERKNQDPLRMYERKYTRNSRAVGVLWGIFTAIFAAIVVLVFIQPFWLGNRLEPAEGGGHFGLYQYCVYDAQGEKTCPGSLSNFDAITSVPFKVATVFVGLGVIFILLSILCFLLFFFVKPRTVFTMCGSLQIVTFFCLLIGCLAYPFGWQSAEVRSLCSQGAASFRLGNCEIRWAFIMAIISVADAFLLAILAFVLALKELKLPRRLPQYNGESNTGFDGGSLARNGRAGKLDMDRMSQFSTVSVNEPNYANRYNGGAPGVSNYGVARNGHGRYQL